MPAALRGSRSCRASWRSHRRTTMSPPRVVRRTAHVPGSMHCLRSRSIPPSRCRALSIRERRSRGTPALALAHDANTELRVIDRQIETQRARLALAGALRNPDVIPSAALTHVAAPEFDYGWRAGVAIAVPLFTTHRAGVELEQSTLDQLSAQRQASLSRIDALVSSAAVLAQTRRQLYLRYRDEIIPLAQEVEQVAQDSYQLGQTGIVSLLQALQSSRDVRLRFDRCRLAVSEFAGRPRARDRRATAVRTLMESRRWLLALAMSAALGAGACTQSTPEEVESEAVVPVRTVAAEKGTIRGVVRATGLVTPAPGAELIVIAPEAARITEIHLGEGERVKRGDVLVRFEIPGAAAEVQKQAAEVKRAQAALANATANQTRAQRSLQARCCGAEGSGRRRAADCGRAGRRRTGRGSTSRCANRRHTLRRARDLRRPRREALSQPW